MAKKYNNGIVSPKGFDMAAPEPSDQRDIVQFYTDLTSLRNCYPGIEVKIEEQQYAKYRLLALPSSLLSNWALVESGIGATGPAGPVGADGADGDSAYQVYLNNGGLLSEVDWLASLKGTPGTPGSTGPAGPIGPTGPQGIPGETNVQTDWLESDILADEYLKNKPTKLSDFENDLPASAGDMLKSEYAAGMPAGRVAVADNALNLNGLPASTYDQSAHVANAAIHLTTDERAALTGMVNPPSTSNKFATMEDLADVAPGSHTHLATDIVVTPSGNLSSVNAQLALVELQSDIDTRVTLSTTQTISGSKTFNNISLFNNGVTEVGKISQPSTSLFKIESTGSSSLTLTSTNHISLEAANDISINKTIAQINAAGNSKHVVSKEWVADTITSKLDVFSDTILKITDYSTANNNAETSKVLFFSSIDAPHTVTLDSTNLTEGFEQQIFNSSGQDLTIASSETIYGANMPLETGYFAYYKLHSPGEWLISVGGAAGGGGDTGGAVDSVNGMTGVVTLTYTNVNAAPTIHTHAISDVTGLQTALNNAVYDDAWIQPEIDTKLDIFDSALAKTNDYSTANNNSEAATTLIFEPTNAPHTITLSDTGLTMGFKQQVFNNSGQSLTITSAETILGSNEPLANGYFAYYKLVAANTWIITVGGESTGGGGAVDSVNGFTGVVVLNNTHVGAAATSHTHIIADTTGLQTALNNKVEIFQSALSKTNDYTTESNNSESGKVLIFGATNAPHVVTLSDTGLTIGFEQQIFNNSGVDLTISSAETVNGANTALANGYFAYYKLVAANEWLISVGGSSGGSGGTVDSVNGFTGAVTLDYSDVGAAPVVHTHIISDVTSLQTTLDGKASTTHAHGNITNTGYLGTIAVKPLITGTAGIIQAGSFGTTSGTFAEGNHTHGQITTAGAIGSTAGLIIKTTTAGVLSALTAGTTDQYLRGDGTWQTISAGGVASITGQAPITSSGGLTPQIGITAATTIASGSMSAADKVKLDGIATGATNYVHPTSDGNLHVPATGTTNNGKILTAGATAGSLSWSTPAAGTVLSVTAGNGMTQTGTSTLNPTLNIVSHTGTAGSIGTLAVTADSVGVNLGTTNITAAAGNHTHTNFVTLDTNQTITGYKSIKNILEFKAPSDKIVGWFQPVDDNTMEFRAVNGAKFLLASGTNMELEAGGNILLNKTIVNIDSAPASSAVTKEWVNAKAALVANNNIFSGASNTFNNIVTLNQITGDSNGVIDIIAKDTVDSRETSIAFLDPTANFLGNITIVDDDSPDERRMIIRVVGHPTQKDYLQLEAGNLITAEASGTGFRHYEQAETVAANLTISVDATLSFGKTYYMTGGIAQWVVLPELSGTPVIDDGWYINVVRMGSTSVTLDAGLTPIRTKSNGLVVTTRYGAITIRAYNNEYIVTGDI